MAQYAEVTADAAVGLSRVDPAWTGAAYAAFWEALTTHRAGFVDATEAFHTASDAMLTYAVELEAAKAQAATAQDRWAAGMDAARAYAWNEFLSGTTLSPPTAADSVMLAFSPGGASLRADAVSRLDGAWADVDRAARAAIDALVTAQAKAPAAPHWWDTAGPKLTGLFAVGDNPVKHEFAAGAVRGLIDLGLSGDRSITTAVSKSLDLWEKSQHINPAGGIHAVGAIAGTLLIPGFGEEGFLASLAAKLANRSITRVLEETAMSATVDAAEGAVPVHIVEASPDLSIAGMTQTEVDVADAARNIYMSEAMTTLRSGAARGTAVQVRVNGMLIQYEPGLPASGMTMFGSHGFVLGPEAFTSENELAATIAHEVYRLATTQSSAGVSADLVSSETAAAFEFSIKVSRYVVDGDRH